MKTMKDKVSGPPKVPRFSFYQNMLNLHNSINPFSDVTNENFISQLSTTEMCVRDLKAR